MNDFHRLSLGTVVCCLLTIILIATQELVTAEEQETAEARATSQTSVLGDHVRDDAVALAPSTDRTEGLANIEQAKLDEGKALFRGLCSGCHGGAGRGGKGPDLTDDRWLHGNTDEDISRVIHNGVPGTTMKKLGESLKEEQIQKLILYIRSLAALAGDSNWQPYMKGDPVAGEQLFFDPKNKALCFNCHTVKRRGGRIGPPLDRIASRRAAPFIMKSIVLPSEDIDPRYENVVVLTNSGKIITGIRINETNFSIQLREQDGRFHSLDKRDLEELKTSELSMMPNTIVEQLTVKELHDVFAFLMTLE